VQVPASSLGLPLVLLPLVLRLLLRLHWRACRGPGAADKACTGAAAGKRVDASKNEAAAQRARTRWQQCGAKSTQDLRLQCMRHAAQGLFWLTGEVGGVRDVC
jgi:hypothetical protein